MMKHILIVLTGLMLSVTTSAADYYVDINATGANNGSSWANAWTSLTTAMTTTPSGNTINVAGGTYIAPMWGWRPSNNNLTLIAKTGETPILSGDTNGDDTFVNLLEDPCALVVAVESGDHMENANYILNLSEKTVTIDGFTISGAKDGAIECSDTDNISNNTVITINNCVFTQNYTDDYGACIGADDGVDAGEVDGFITITNCRFVQNSSWNRGTALHTRQAGTVNIDNCYFSIMTGVYNVGTIYLRDQCPGGSVTNCIFDRCMTTPNSGDSMGVMTWFDTNAEVTVANCVFTECESFHNGAAVYARADNDGITVTVNVNNCLATGCTNHQVSGDDVAMFAQVAHATTDTHLTLNITNCTISDNHTNGQGHVGGAVEANSPTIDATINLKNTIIWGNTGGPERIPCAQLYKDTAQPGNPRVFVNADYCCWDNTDPNDLGYTASLGTGNLLKKADPSLDPGFDVNLYSAFALAATSPCIDTGDPTSDYSAEPKCNGGRINMGAYGGTAYATPTATSTKLADLDCDNDVDLADFTAMSNQWLL